MPRSELIEELQRTDEAVRDALGKLPASALAQPYPLPVANRRLVTGEFLDHLAVHLAYHLGQMDFHRRIVTGDVTGVGAVSPADLPGARPIESGRTG